MRRICDAYAKQVHINQNTLHLCWLLSQRLAVSRTHLRQLIGLQPLPDDPQQLINHIHDPVEPVRGGVVEVQVDHSGVDRGHRQRPMQQARPLAREAVRLPLVSGQGQHVIQVPLPALLGGTGLVLVELRRPEGALGADAPGSVGQHMLRICGLLEAYDLAL